MTRLTSDDVRQLTQRLDDLETQLRDLCGMGLRDLALRTLAEDGGGPGAVPAELLRGARVAAVPVTSGLGVIGGFTECVTAVLRHLGCEAWVTSTPDVGGLQQALHAGAEAVFLADDARFIAVNPHEGRCVDDDPATADAYVTALEVAAGGFGSEAVLLLGLGPVGAAAAARLVGRGADVLVVEPDATRRDAVTARHPRLSAVGLDEGLRRCRLIFDATPAAGFIDAPQLRDDAMAAVPGLPSGFTPAAQAALGSRHLHEPLALGVSVMAARALQ